MPVGWDTGSVGAGVGGRPVDLDALSDAWNRVRDVGRDLLEPVWDLVGRVVSVARWVLETVQVLYPVEWFAWDTPADERTCPECASLIGRTWPEDAPSAPDAPVHVNCRCRVVHAFTEWRVRYVAEWRLRIETAIAWDWEIVAWR